MGLYQRENGIFYLQVHAYDNHENNTSNKKPKYKRISLGTRDYKLAQRMYDNYLLSEINQKLHPTKSTYTELNQPTVKSSSNKKEIKKHSIEKTYNEYLELCKSQNLSKDVLYSKTRLLRYLKSVKVEYIDEISQDVIIKLVSNFKTETANKHLRNLKAYLNFCIKKKYYKREDYETLDFLMTKQNVREVVIVEEDYKKLIGNTNNDDFRLYMMTLWETGCRPSEITQLKKRDIDFNKGTAKIYQNKTKKYKIVYFTDELLSIFNTIQTEYIFLGNDKNDTDYSRKFKKLKDELKLNKEYCLYAFRHSFGEVTLGKR